MGFVLADLTNYPITNDLYLVLINSHQDATSINDTLQVSVLFLQALL